MAESADDREADGYAVSPPAGRSRLLRVAFSKLFFRSGTNRGSYSR